MKRYLLAVSDTPKRYNKPTKQSTPVSNNSGDCYLVLSSSFPNARHEETHTYDE